MEEIRCRNCNMILFETYGTRKGEKTAIVPKNPEVKLEHGAGGYFIRCYYCSAKNMARRMTDNDGEERLEIVSFVMDDW
jgi:hypothetical protein